MPLWPWKSLLSLLLCFVVCCRLSTLLCFQQCLRVFLVRVWVRFLGFTLTLSFRLRLGGLARGFSFCFCFASGFGIGGVFLLTNLLAFLLTNLLVFLLGNPSYAWVPVSLRWRLLGPMAQRLALWWLWWIVSVWAWNPPQNRLW